MMNETLIPEEPPKKKFPRLGKRGKIAAGALAVVVLAALVLPRLGQGTAAAVLPYQLYQAARQNLTVSVSGSATLEPADSYQVTTRHDPGCPL